MILLLLPLIVLQPWHIKRLRSNLLFISTGMSWVCCQAWRSGTLKRQSCAPAPTDNHCCGGSGARIFEMSKLIEASWHLGNHLLIAPILAPELVGVDLRHSSQHHRRMNQESTPETIDWPKRERKIHGPSSWQSAICTFMIDGAPYET